LHAGIHGLFADVLIALGAGHLLVTLFHQFVLRDNLLARMRPR
jgi:cytochrome b561